MTVKPNRWRTWLSALAWSALSVLLLLVGLVLSLGRGIPHSSFWAHGMVVDLAGKPVPGATVNTFNQEVMTDGRGCFLISEYGPHKLQMPFSVDASGSKSFKGTLAAPGQLRVRVVLADAVSGTESVVDTSPATDILFSCEPSSAWASIRGTSDHTAPSIRIATLSELAAHVGEYPCRNGLLQSPVLTTVFKDLGAQWHRSELPYSSCAAVAQRGSWILLDLFRHKTEGFELLILVNPQTSQVYGFWGPGRPWVPLPAGNRPMKIRGPLPVPREVSTIIVDELTSTWGHAATFSWRDGAIQIAARKAANTGGRSGG